MPTYDKPLPKITKLDRPFWEAAKRHELRLQKCRACGNVWFPAYTTCPKCLSPNYEWALMSGKGKVWSWTVFHQFYFKSFEKDLPYNAGFIQLDEGPIIPSNIVGCSPQDIKCDMRVQAIFDDVTDEVSLPRFKPI